MSDLPSNLIVPSHVHTWTRQGIAFQNHLYQQFGSASSGDWVTNVAVYVPIYLPWPYRVQRLFGYCGNTVGSGNLDVGVYTVGGGRIYSTGSVALSGGAASAPLYSAADILLSAGAYFLAYACDSGGGGTGHAYGMNLSALIGRTMGLYKQASAFPLPAKATFAAWDGSPFVPLVGFTNTSSGF